MSNQAASWRRTLILALGVALASAGVLAAQAVGPEVPIWVDPVHSHEPAVAFNIIHEEFLVVWWNERGPDSIDVYARRVGLDGSVGSWFAVAAVPGEKNFEPVVAYNHVRDEYFVVWTNEYVVNDDDIWGSIMTWNGSTIGTPILINGQVDEQERPVVVFNPDDDEYLVVYQNSWSSGVNDIAAQRVDGDGTLLSWANVASGGVTSRVYPTAAFHPGVGQYLIAYIYAEAPTWYPRVRGKVAAADLDGVSIAPEITIFDDPSIIAIAPAVAAHGSGYLAQFKLPWNPFVIRLAADGSPAGSPNPFQIGEAVGGSAATPTRANAVAATDTVGYVSVWHDIQTVYGDIYGRVVSPFSDSLLTSQLDVSVGPEAEQEVAIACAPWGTCLVAYEDNGNIAARLLRFNLFGDGFESGGPGAWSGFSP